MKLIPFLLLSLSTTAQVYHYDPNQGSWTEDSASHWHTPREAVTHHLAISAGINYSSFVGPGYYGHGIVGAALGMSDVITMNGGWRFMPELSYEHKGVFNKAESRNFNTYSIQATPFVGYQIHSLYLIAGPYYERVLFASNSSFSGGNFSWAGSRWKFWRRNQLGITAAVRIDLNGSMLQVEYQYGLSQVRNELNDWTGKPSLVLWKNHNSVGGIRWVLPLSVFGQ